MYGSQPVNITLDSGATVSFIRLDTATALNLKILPNNQLATLADEKTKLASLGEVNITLKRGPITANLRALVVKNLQAPIFGGMTFLHDNDVIPLIKRKQIKLGNFTIFQTNPDLPTPTQVSALIQTNQPITPNQPNQPTQPANTTQPANPNQPIVLNTTTSQSPKFKAILIKTTTPTTILPHTSHQLPTNHNLPPEIHLKHTSPSHLQQPIPSLCTTTDNTININNQTNNPIHLPKHTLLRAIPITQNPVPTTSNLQKSIPSKTPTILHPNTYYTDQVKLNKSALSRNQLATVYSILNRNISALNDDISEGYNNKSGRYECDIEFKDNSRPTSNRFSTPQYNRRCQDLQQAVMDTLESKGVLVDPQDHNIEVKNVSPCFIIQKMKARHKKLEECSIDELRFVIAFNKLNEHIRPKPTRITTHKQIFTSLARWKYHIFADLKDSYFQNHMKKSKWGYLGVYTPHKGLRVMTRSAQGLLNQDAELDGLVDKVLGEEKAEGITTTAHDDIVIGGNTIDEAIRNFDRVFTKLAENNLKLSPSKIRILLDNTEIYGWKIKNGKISPSDHIITSLDKINIDSLKTVKSINSWKGLYKQLIPSLSQVATLLDPFDKICAGRDSTEKIEWTPDLIAGFNAAKEHLNKVSQTVLPHPTEQLILMPDAAKSVGGIGWVLYVVRDKNLCPVQFYSAKVKTHMKKWNPCELEAVASATAIEACSHWIVESHKHTIIAPDSKAVVEATHRMKQGKMSTSPRLQAILSSINRRPVIFVHSSAKMGQHIVADFCSRIDTTCSSQDCAIERFLDQYPEQIECMKADCSSILLRSLSPCQIAALSDDIERTIMNNNGELPLGSRKAWSEIQQSDYDCKNVFELIASGDSPRKKLATRSINSIFKNAIIDKQLLVVPQFDQKSNRMISRVVIPPKYLDSILTMLHLKANHATKYQLDKVFQRYFFCPGLSERIDKLLEECHLCQSLKNAPNVKTTDLSPEPTHPGTHMNIDVMKRNRQNIVVNVDIFSNYVTSCIMPSESKTDMKQAIIQLVTPIRHSGNVQVKTDKASAFKSLKEDTDLQRINITITNTLHFNKNANCEVDKAIQELQHELIKLVDPSDQITSTDLARATTILNSRLRNRNLSASEVHFCRDSYTGENLHLNDTHLQKKKTHNSPSPEEKYIPSGRIVHTANKPSKYNPKDTFLVTGTDQNHAEVHKFLHELPTSKRAMKISSNKQKCHSKFLTPVTQHKTSEEPTWSSHKIPVKTDTKGKIWTPTPVYNSDPETEPEIEPEEDKQQYEYVLPPNPPQNRSSSEDSFDSIPDNLPELPNSDNEQPEPLPQRSAAKIAEQRLHKLYAPRRIPQTDGAITTPDTSLEDQNILQLLAPPFPLSPSNEDIMLQSTPVFPPIIRNTVRRHKSSSNPNILEDVSFDDLIDEDTFYNGYYSDSFVENQLYRDTNENSD